MNVKGEVLGSVASGGKGLLWTQIIFESQLFLLPFAFHKVHYCDHEQCVAKYNK